MEYNLIMWLKESCESFKSLLLQEANTFADEHNLLFMETSAKTAMNVTEVFLAIGLHLHFLIYLWIKWQILICDTSNE